MYIYNPDDGERRANTMKEPYETPEMEIIEFEADEIWTGSEHPSSEGAE